MSEEEKAYCIKITGLPARGAPSYNERVKQKNRRRDGKERGRKENRRRRNRKRVQGNLEKTKEGPEGMKKKKAGRILALAMAFSMLLAGACGQAPAEIPEETAETAQQSGESTESAAETQQETQSGGEAAAVSEYPDYLNLENTYPVIKEDAEPIKLKVAMTMQDASGEWDDLWLSKYLKEKYNIELEMEYLYYSTLPERKSLMLNSGDLPDIMINWQFTTDELVKYGQEEGLLLACDEYMNETLTPGLTHYWTDEVRKACTTPDGHVYSLPNLKDGSEENVGSLSRLFINKAWLDELGLEMPRTLDEFVDAMYAIKEADPAGVGSENLYPLGGGMTTENTTWYLLNALGYNTASTTVNASATPCIRDGEVVIPVYDMDVYQEYLKLMNQFYQDGIINSNFFTIETTEVNAQMNAGQTAVYNNAPFVSGITTWSDWAACYPLTSDWQEEPEAADSPTVTVGGVAISADTEYPELCMRFLDIFYNNEPDSCRQFWGGPGDPQYDYGFVTVKWDEEAQEMRMDATQFPEGYAEWDYMVELMAGNTMDFGAGGLRESIVKRAADNGHEMAPHQEYDVTIPDHHWRASMAENVVPYVKATFPTIYYVDAETSQRLTDLLTVIQPYVEEQTALFISGGRPLSETADFVEELEGMGMEELLTIYKDIYSAYNNQ